MVRTQFTLILVGAGICALAAVPDGTNVLSCCATARAADAIGAENPTVSLGQLVLRDTFDDNIKGPMWRFLADDPNQCTLQEANQRLELVATGLGGDIGAAYVSGGWRLDPRHDFAIKVDYHYDLTSFARGAIGIGVAADVNDPWRDHVAVGVGCAGKLANYWYRQRSGYTVESSIEQRQVINGTLYVEYDAAADAVSVGLLGYGEDNAWSVVPGLLQGRWKGRPAFLWLMGTSDGLAVPSGRAYLDNLMIERGTVIEAALQEVYRFWSPVLGRHFYTISKAEKEMLLTRYPQAWTYEGVVYHAFANDSDPDTKPVHRFWSGVLSSHFYTLNEAEKDKLINEYSHVWFYEGVAFYAYPSGNQPDWARPVYRFWSPGKSCHFYTMSEAERQAVLTTYAQLWVDEGIAWYANE